MYRVFGVCTVCRRFGKFCRHTLTAVLRCELQAVTWALSDLSDSRHDQLVCVGVEDTILRERGFSRLKKTSVATRSVRDHLQSHSFQVLQYTSEYDERYNKKLRSSYGSGSHPSEAM